VKSICNDSYNSSERSRLVFYRSPYVGERTEDIFTRRPRYKRQSEILFEVVYLSAVLVTVFFSNYLGNRAEHIRTLQKISFEGRSTSVEAASYPIGIWASRQIVTNSGMLLKVANSDIMISSLARSEPSQSLRVN
jgi:hypothetical protein